jgi:hypothetical protein
MNNLGSVGASPQVAGFQDEDIEEVKATSYTTALRCFKGIISAKNTSDNSSETVKKKYTDLGSRELASETLLNQRALSQIITPTIERYNPDSKSMLELGSGFCPIIAFLPETFIDSVQLSDFDPSVIETCKKKMALFKYQETRLHETFT